MKSIIFLNRIKINTYQMLFGRCFFYRHKIGADKKTPVKEASV
ncbi:hypothetical protein [uncultured Mucilaginibacter sp.]|nr:hypothetical protein [uncultured Mucilaginibacter sp.]